MLAHWSDAYVGLPYAEADCAELCARVQREIFGREVYIPTERGETHWSNSAQLEDEMGRYLIPLEPGEARDGDVVQMRCAGRLRHPGTLCVIGRRPYVLHALREPGQTLRTPLLRLGDLFITVAGYYRWR